MRVLSASLLEITYRRYDQMAALMSRSIGVFFPLILTSMIIGCIVLLPTLNIESSSWDSDSSIIKFCPAPPLKLCWKVADLCNWDCFWSVRCWLLFFHPLWQTFVRCAFLWHLLHIESQNQQALAMWSVYLQR